MADVSIYWFRDDLRLADLPGLSAAAQAGVIPVFVRDPDLGEAWRIGSASQWWLHHSLLSLRTSLAEQGLDLILRSGETVEALAALAAHGRNHRLLQSPLPTLVGRTRNYPQDSACRRQGRRIKALPGHPAP